MDEMRWYNPEHGNGAAVDGRLSKYAISDITSTFTSTLNYAFSLFNDHHIGLLAGYEAYKNTYSMLHAHATGFSNSEMIELSMASTKQILSFIQYSYRWLLTVCTWTSLGDVLVYRWQLAYQ